MNNNETEIFVGLFTVVSIKLNKVRKRKAEHDIVPVKIQDRIESGVGVKFYIMCSLAKILCAQNDFRRVILAFGKKVAEKY